MRDLQRNQVKIYYKTYLGETEIVDSNNNATGIFEKTYSDLKSFYISVSANKGTTEADAFGTALDYDRTLSTANLSCDIDEYSILWLDDADPTKQNPDPYNAIVQKKAKSLNQLLYAVKMVVVSG